MNNHGKSLNMLIIMLGVVLILYVLKPILMPLIFAVLLAAIVYPVLHFLETRLHFGPGLTSLLGVLIFCGIAITLVVFISSQFSTFIDHSDLYSTKFGELWTNLLAYLDTKTSLDIAPLHKLRMPELSTLWARSGDTITDAFSITSHFIGDLFMVPIYMFFILYYRSFLIEFLHRAFAHLPNDRMESILQGLFDVVQNYLRGMLTVMLIVGVLNSIGLLILGIENAIFFGFLGALLLLIPYIGIIMGSLFPALVALVTKDSYWYVVGVFAVFVFVQFLEGNFITPRVAGSKMSMNAFISVIALFLFSMLWGMAGLVLALPLTAMLKVVFDHSESLQAWGYLIGETEDHHTRKNNMIWMRLRMKYKKK
ncbi:MAG: AI-2E family transporter [Flavobacteriales bacterium]